MNVNKAASILPCAAKIAPSIGRRCRIRWLHQTASRHAITKMEMPAMSPTMTEGGIATWKKKEGESFAAGDVLLEIETDKATIDVEAQDDGVMAKILLPDGTKNIPVGKLIALLAEEGDDMSNLEIPKEDTSSPSVKASELQPSSLNGSPPPPPISTPSPPLAAHHKPSHPLPLFPSVHRLLLEHASAIPDATKVKGTGIRGMLTKGDVLAHLGLASSPTGTFKDATKDVKEGVKRPEGGVKADEDKPLDGAALRRLIVSTLLQSSIRAQNASLASKSPPDFDSIINDYLPPAATHSTGPSSAISSDLSRPPAHGTDYLEGLY